MHIYKISSNAESLSTTPKTILAWITGATRRARVLTMMLTGSSVTQSDAPVLIEVVRFATDGTGTSITPQAVDSANPAAIATAKRTYTVEPGTPTVVDSWRVSPIGNTVIWELPRDVLISMDVSKVMGLRATLVAGTQSNFAASMTVEE
jgi:hypothetical protein